MPKFVIIFKEHHGERAFVYDTEDQKDIILCAMAKERLDSDYGFYDTEPKGDPDLFKSETAHLSEADLVRWHLDRIGDASLRKGKPDTYFIKSLSRWMNRRSNYEDEGYTTYPIETAELEIGR